LEWKSLVHFMDIRYFMIIWYRLWLFGIFWYVVPRNIWQSWLDERHKSFETVFQKPGSSDTRVRQINLALVLCSELRHSSPSVNFNPRVQLHP
jgi:hypothetical protein